MDMCLAKLNRIITTLLNKLNKKSWCQTDSELVHQYIEEMREWLDDLEEEFNKK